MRDHSWFKQLFCAHRGRETVEASWDEADGRVLVVQRVTTCMRCGLRLNESAP